ncbi:MAG: ABC transporter substrate-binding protein [Cellulomonadaceae bacterium]
MRLRSPQLLAAAGLSALLLAGCSAGPDSSETAEPSADTYSVTHEAGTTENVPVDPKKIVVLDEYAALNMMEIGVVPDVVFGGLSSEVGAVILEEEGVELIAAPTMILEPDFEAIAAEEPDLIVLTTPGATIEETYPSFSEIAPTIVLPYEKPWQEMLELTGQAFQREEQADAVATALQKKLDAVTAEAGSDAGSISVLGSFQDIYYSPAMINPMSLTLEAVGFTRPQVEVDGVPSGASTTAVMFSAEELPEHDADTVVLMDGSIYNAAAVQALPTFSTLSAAQNDRVFLANGELWSANFALGTWWVLDDIETILTSGTSAPLGSIDDAIERWDALQAAIGS